LILSWALSPQTFSYAAYIAHKAQRECRLNRHKPSGESSDILNKQKSSRRADRIGTSRASNQGLQAPAFEPNS